VYFFKSEQPNILFILTDDLGAADVSFNYPLINPGKEPPIKTPTLDRFANEGTILRNYYTDNMCGPSRNAILTSRWTHQLGNPFPFKMEAGSLNDTYRTVAMEFQDRGYKTAMFGKWGIDIADLFVNENAEWVDRGRGRGYGPTKRGFDVFEGHLSSGVEHYLHHTRTSIGMTCDHHRFDEHGRKSAPGKPGAPGEIPCPIGEYSTDTTTRTTIDFLRDPKTRDQPFFLSLSFFAPHNPIQAPEQFIQAPHCQKLHSWKRRTYCGMVGTVDDAVKRITDVLDELGLLDSTIIVFTSDNGAYPLVAGSNYPYRGGKLTIFEGGLHVPAFIYGPKFNIPIGKLHQPYTAHVDWGPTLLSLADETSESPSGSAFIDDVDGMNLLPSLRDEPNASVRTNFLLHQNVLAPQYVYYQNDLKLLYNSVELSGHQAYLFPEPDTEFYLHSSLRTWDLVVAEWFCAFLRNNIPLEPPPPYAVHGIVAQLNTPLKHLKQWTWRVSTGEPITNSGLYLPMADLEWEWDRIRLHNVTEDPSESNDIKDEHKEEIEKMILHLKEVTKTMPPQTYAQYYYFNKLVNFLYIVMYLAFFLIICTPLCTCYCCMRCRRSKQKRD